MLNKNTLGVKKVRGQEETASRMNWRLKALISGEAKKFIIANCLKILLYSERHAHNGSHAGYFTIMHDQLCHLATFLTSS